MAPKKSRPPLIIGKTDADRLTALALKIEVSNPELADLLLGELERASIRSDQKVPPTTVTMNSLVEFIDQAHGTTRAVELVYPNDADISKNRISVLTPVGAGLIGLSPGQSIMWPDRDGHTRQLRILSVERPGVAATAQS